MYSSELCKYIILKHVQNIKVILANIKLLLVKYNDTDDRIKLENS